MFNGGSSYSSGNSNSVANGAAVSNVAMLMQDPTEPWLFRMLSPVTVPAF